MLRLQPQSAERKMLEGLQDLRTSLQEELFVAAVHIGEDFRIAASVRSNYVHCNLQLKSSRANSRFQKVSQGSSRSLPIELPVLNKFLSHDLNQSKRMQRTTVPVSIPLLFLAL